MPAPRTWFDARGLRVAASGASASDGGTDADAAHLPFYAGAMHYWRVDPRDWPACLRAIRELGLALVETYVPWRVHQPAAGALGWSGERDLARFLVAAGAAGLGVVLRPGPHVNAELTSFGIPDWVLDDPACLAQTARGTPAWLPAAPRAFPIPSYASRAFQRHVRAWYAAVAAVVAPHLAPDGPVVAIGVDNEAQLFFRTGAYDLDYHPDALAWWREQPGVAAGADAPRAWDAANAAVCARWVAFKDEYIARALGDFAAMLGDVGLGGVARFHNLPPGSHTGYDLRRIQARVGGPVGIDAYTSRAQLPELRRRAAALAGNAQPLPIAFEVGVGWMAWLPPLDATDADATARERDQLLTLLAGGARGFNLFMAVERDRYYGAAIDRSGKIEARAAWIPPVIAALGDVDWPSLRRRAPIAVLDQRADARFGAASCLIDPLTPVLADALGLGPGGAAELGTDDGAVLARTWQSAVCRALELAQVGYAIVDERAPVDELARYRAVIAPTTARVDRAAWATLRELAENKRCVVVIGPGTPVRDEWDAPLAAQPRRMGMLQADSLGDLAGLAADLAALAGNGSGDNADDGAWTFDRPLDRPGPHTSVFVDDAGRARVVFAISDAPEPVTATLVADAATRFVRDLVTGEVLPVRDRRAVVTVRGIRMLHPVAID